MHIHAKAHYIIQLFKLYCIYNIDGLDQHDFATTTTVLLLHFIKMNTHAHNCTEENDAQAEMLKLHQNKN